MLKYTSLLLLLFICWGAPAHELPEHDPYLHLDRGQSSVAFTQTEIDYIINTKEITMCTDPNWMPYEGFDNGERYIGVAADFHSIISHITGLRYNIIHTDSWSETIQKAQSGECDILSILNKTPERTKYLDFTKAYIQSPTVFVTREQDKFINGIEDLRGQTLAIVEGYMVDEYITENHPEINRIYTKSIPEALRMVSKGKAFSTVGSLLEMSYNMRQMGLLNLKITGDAKMNFELRIGVRKGEPLLLSIMDKAISSISKQERNEILNKWISIKYQQGYDYALLIKLLIGFFILLVFIIGKTVLTSKYNRKLEEMNQNLEKRIAEETSRRLENERILMQQSKLAAMGDMIGAIAHQWRQPLNAVGLIIQDIEDAYETETLDHALLKKDTKNAMGIINQMSDTITDFSNFFRPDKTYECFKICTSINDVASMLISQMTSHNIALHINCMGQNLDGLIRKDKVPFACCSSMSVQGYPNEFKHVVLNILKNAMDALDETVRANKAINVSINHSGEEHIVIAISDNAGGIPEEIASRIFEPYFSTKMEGKGVGIGLYMSKQILENMDGTVWFENSTDGASFFIKLKLCKAEISN